MTPATLQPAPSGRTGEAPQRVSSHVYSRADLTWRSCPDGSLALHCYGRAAAIVHVVPDAKHAELWRIAHPDGHLWDLVSFTRAKDAAAAVALGILNRGRRHQEAA
jgi:hypothetical protein